MLTTDNIVELYSAFNKTYFNLTEKYRFKPSDTQLKKINKFLSDDLLKFKGDDFIFKYMTFQFSYYDGMELENTHGRMLLDYIIGKKAIKRWKERDTNFDYKLQTSKVLRSQFEWMFEEKWSISKIDRMKKKQFHNTDFGFQYCIENTSLYDTKHIECITCDFKVKCKSLLERYNNAKVKR